MELFFHGASTDPEVLQTYSGNKYYTLIELQTLVKYLKSSHFLNNLGTT